MVCTVEPHYNEVLGTMNITLLYQVSHYMRVQKQRNIELGPAKLPCYTVRGLVISDLFIHVPRFHCTTHTHTHVWTFNHGLQPWPWDFWKFTCNRGHTLSVFTDEHRLFVCVKFNYQSMDYPLPVLPLPKSNIGLFFLHACLCDLLRNGGCLTIVDVHGWCVSTVVRDFSDGCPWLKVLTHTHK